MSGIKKSLVLCSLLLLPVMAHAGGTIVKDVPSYQRAAAEACVGKSVGASCTIEFQGGSVTIGFCVEIPGPAGGYLECKINPEQIPSCKKNSLVGSPTTAAMFMILAGGLFLLRRKKAAV